MQVNITLRKIENPKAGVDSVYAAGVQHDATLNAEDSAPSISAYLKVTPAQFKAAWRALAAGLKRQAKLGNQSTVDIGTTKKRRARCIHRALRFTKEAPWAL